MSDYDYDREAVLDELQGLAEVRLKGPVTVELTQWDDGDFRAVAYHTIDATYPFKVEARNDEHGLPYYREQLTFATNGDDEGWTAHEVVRRRCGETGWDVVWSERVGGYTFNWPDPITDDDDDRSVGPKYRFSRRFA